MFAMSILNVIMFHLARRAKNRYFNHKSYFFPYLLSFIFYSILMEYITPNISR